MKILITSFIILLVSLQVSSQVFGQKKSKVDPKDAKIATLTKQLDSLTGVLAVYVGVYDTLKKKVVHYNFDPARTTILIDSLMTRRDSTSKVVIANCDDTIAKLNKKYNTLKAFVDSAYSAVERSKAASVEAEIDRANAVTVLKQLRELVVAKILTEEEFATLKKKYLVKL
jgi:hypothetical protein